MSTQPGSDARALLAEIRKHDPSAAALALQRLEQLEREEGNVALWTSQIELALTSIRKCGRTRLADMARHEMGLPNPD